MAVTIKDIAKVCNISYSTVSRVLNGKNVRKTEQNDRIIATAKALGYKPNTLAVQLVKQSSNMLGLMIPDIANPHYSEVTKCVEDAALMAGYRVFLCNTDWDVRKEVLYRDSLLESRVAGIVIMPVCDESHVIFRGLDIPVVLLGSRTLEQDLHFVVMDNERAAYMAAEHFIRAGRRHLCYIARNVANHTSEDRTKGFLRAAEEYGLPAKNVRVVPNDGFGFGGARRVTKRLLEEKEPPDAILAFNDFIAIGAMQSVEEKGLTVGKDISVIGVDDILFSSLPKIDLTTITPSNKELGRTALSMVMARRDGMHLARHAVLEPHMIIRGSCGRVEQE